MRSPVEIVDWLVDRGFASDVQKMLIGENEYADLEAFEILDNHSRQLRRMAIRHLEFFVEYGDALSPVEVNGQVHSPYPEYFEAWKLAGCPGVSISLLEKLYNVRST